MAWCRGVKAERTGDRLPGRNSDRAARLRVWISRIGFRVRTAFHRVVVRGPLIDAESPGGLSPAGARASHASQNGNDAA